MRLRRLFWMSPAWLVLTLVFPAAATEPASVTVTLWNKGSVMGLTLDKKSVPSGPVEFHVKNASTSIMHEFLIAPWQGPLTSLPYDPGASQVAEDKIPDLQGQEDMPPGMEATLRLTLRSGSYIVFCNQPGHYKMGMFARLEVGGSP
jgi:uncharacterized cupredoxin-like copper-binding protein